MVLFLVGACASRKLPEEAPPKMASQALEPAGEGQLADLADKIAAKFGKDVSSVLAMDRNDDAFRWRLMLVDLAEQSIDLQGKLYWVSGDARVNSQPARTFWRRIGDGFFSLLPIKDQL